MALKELLKEIEQLMQKAVDSTKREFNELRSGRANPKMVEGIRVNYYGTPTLLKDIAAINVSDARLIVINPWDPSALKEIEKSLLQADLGITPIIDGKIIRLVIPALSEERRGELFKVVKKMAEEGKVSLRTIRREAKDKIKSLEKDKKITEDEKFKGEESIQKLIDEFSKKIDSVLEEKEKELKEF